MKITKIITLVIIVTVAVSCKKSEQNNPNITYTNINKTLTIGTTDQEYDLDINKDGISDLKFVAGTRYNTSDMSYFDYAYTHSLNDSVEAVRKRLIIPWKSSRYSYLVAGSLTDDYLIGPTAQIDFYWENPIRPAASIYIKIRDAISADSTEFKAFSEMPKSYIAVKIRNNKSYFGWVRVSTSMDGKSMTIYDAAISKLPEIPIKAGEK